jgi:N-acetylmuramoyl-L-alanine amidase
MSLKRRIVLTVLLLLPAVLAQAATLENIRVWTESGRTRVVLDLSAPAEHNIFTLRGPDRLVVDLKSSRLSAALRDLPRNNGSIRTIRTGVRADGQIRVVLDLNQSVRSRSFTAGPNDRYGDRLVIDLHEQGNLRAVKRASDEAGLGRIHAWPRYRHCGRSWTWRARSWCDWPRQNAREGCRAGSRPPARDPYRRRAGHESDPGAQARYFHRERMEIARKNRADLFVSIHADAVDDPRARGASVYVLSLKGASDEAAKRLAQRENASELVGGVSLKDKDAVLASVLLDLSQNAALSAGLDIGGEVIAELAKLGKVHRRTVQQAGFLVLKSPDVPSILIETAYISNPHEEKKLNSGAHQRKLANAILTGIRNYFYENPPPNTQLAMNLKRSPAKQVNHVITRGDTLSEIAERYNVSMSAIRSANKLSGDKVRVGQKLTIPIFAGS